MTAVQKKMIDLTIDSLHSDFLSIEMTNTNRKNYLKRGLDFLWDRTASETEELTFVSL